MTSASERSARGLSRVEGIGTKRGLAARALLLACLCAFVSLSQLGCASLFGGDSIVVEQAVLGIPIRIEVRDPDKERAHAAIRAAFEKASDAGKRLLANRKTSHFGLLNEFPPDTWLQLTGVGFEATQTAVRIASLTGGNYTPARHVLLETWGISDGAPRVPSESEIQDAIVRASWKRLELNEKEKHFKRLGLRTVIDLEGIAVGTMLDHALRALETREVPSALVSTDGLWASYRAEGDPAWRLEITAMRDDGVVEAVAEVVLPEQAALAVVHPREIFVAPDGTRIHEWINPRSGRPVEGVATAAVVAPRAAIAAGLAVGSFMTGDAAPLMLSQRPGSEWILSTREGGQRNSDGIEVRWLRD